MSHVHITNGLNIYNLTKLLAPYPTQTTTVTEDQCCLETVCQIPVWRGRRSGGGGGHAAPRDLLGSPRSSETKGTLWHRLTHPRKHYFLSHQLQHPPHMSCSLPRTESPFLTSSAVKHSQQQSVLTICSYWHSTTVNYICGGTGIHKV